MVCGQIDLNHLTLLPHQVGGQASGAYAAVLALDALPGLTARIPGPLPPRWTFYAKEQWGSTGRAAGHFANWAFWHLVASYERIGYKRAYQAYGKTNSGVGHDPDEEWLEDGPADWTGTIPVTFFRDLWPGHADRTQITH